MLVHGFFRTCRDMSFLSSFFRQQGYETLSPSLPSTFGSLEKCTSIFEDSMKNMPASYEKIHFIGHSMGGLVIRLFFSRNKIEKPGRCILIATPNNGTDLAGIVADNCKFCLAILKPLQSFIPEKLQIPPPLNSPAPEIGVIAGNRQNLITGKYIKGKNDGRVPLESTRLPGMKDFITVPYNHVQIHHTQDVAHLSQKFIESGNFS
ncbi:MAG: alpha/beta hydrolase [Desulfobulbaceae bacterium]|nr:alpha/beta hydrolase [Desulfobulbaceae bacterium]